MKKADEKLIKDIMNAVEHQERIDATVGRSVRELTEQGYKVVIERSEVKSQDDETELKKEFDFWWDKNGPVTVIKRCFNCKFYTNYPHNVHGVTRQWSADGYCDNPDNSRKIIVIDKYNDFCKFFEAKS
jgi:hypothetical protein